MNEKTKKIVVRYTKEEIKRICKYMEQRAIANIDRALSSGMIADDSEFIKDKNSLLAMALLEDASWTFRIKTDEFRKEYENFSSALS